MDIRTRLHIIYNDGGVETNYSAEAQDFKRDTFQVTLTTDDFIYIGFRKVINAVYISLTQVNTVTSSLSFEYYSESGWKALEVSDDTKALARSGFVTWSRPSDAAPLTVDSIEACWVRFAPNDNLSLTEFQAINLLFSDDNDICQEVPALIDACFYQAGQTSHILHHVAAKNYIMGRLRSLGYIKETADGEENIDQWDILDIYELRQASTYYALSQIYFNLSDDIEDQYWVKYKEYEAKFEEMFSLGRLRVDTNDDGQVNLSEKRPIKTVRWVR